ncbi:hypothetical protein D9M72_485400 [compost metagenome]
MHHQMEQSRHIGFEDMFLYGHFDFAHRLGNSLCFAPQLASCVQNFKGRLAWYPFLYDAALRRNAENWPTYAPSTGSKATVRYADKSP